MDFRSFIAISLALVCFLMLANCGKSDKTREFVMTDANDFDIKVERTLSIVKPNAVADNHIGAIVERFENNGLRIAGLKMLHLSQSQAEQFYGIHKDRPFFKDLVNFMVSGPIVVMALEGPDAIEKNRKIMGATDPKKAEKGTIRADFAKSLTENAVHGSDAPQTAATEIAFFFKPEELFPAK